MLQYGWAKLHLSLAIYPIRLVWLNSITLPMRYKPTSQPSPVPMPAKSAFSYPRNCEPTREKLATKKDKNSLSSPPPKVISPSSLPPTPVTTRRRIRKEQGQPRKEGRKEGVSGARTGRTTTLITFYKRLILPDIYRAFV